MKNFKLARQRPPPSKIRPRDAKQQRKEEEKTPREWPLQLRSLMDIDKGHGNMLEILKGYLLAKEALNQLEH